MPTTATALLDRARNLVSNGRGLDAIAILTEANRRRSDPAIERALVQLRHDAWPELAGTPAAERSAAGGSETDVPDRFEGEVGIPEVGAHDLDALALRSAVTHHGALIVRGLLTKVQCAQLRDGIDRCWEAMSRYRSTKEFDPQWFHPIDTSRYGLTMASRAWVIANGTSYVPDSPRLLFDLLEAFDEANVKRVVSDYFGERPALSLIKVAQRRLPPDAKGGWHQDAAVYGLDARTLNFWIPLSRCGDVAPGLAVWPRRLESIIKTAGDDGVAEFTADTATVDALLSEVPPAIPVFDEGDAVIFDQMLLHRTASSLDFTEQRYGFECWFFAPSDYPDPNRFIPLVY